MDDKTKKLMEKMAEEAYHTKQINDKLVEHSAFLRSVYKQGFTAAHTLAEQEIAQLKSDIAIKDLIASQFESTLTETMRVRDDLTASLKSAVDALSYNYEYYAAKQHKCIDLLKDQQQVVVELKAKHPDMFKETK